MKKLKTLAFILNLFFLCDLSFSAARRLPCSLGLPAAMAYMRIKDKGPDIMAAGSTPKIPGGTSVGEAIEKAHSAQEKAELDSPQSPPHARITKASTHPAHSVQFSPSAKTHDQLRPDSRILDELVYAYFETQCISNAADIAKLLKNFPCNLLILSQAHKRFLNLKERVEKLEAADSTPALSTGGGRGLQLQSVHGPHLNCLIELFKQFVIRLEEPAPAEESDDL